MSTQIETMAATAALSSIEPGRSQVRLVVHTSGDDLRTRVIHIAPDAEVTFGRSRTATVSLDSEAVSRLHAKVGWRDGSLVVEDLGSRNGTRINGQLVKEATRLGSGDEIRVGPATAIVSMTSAPRRRIGAGVGTDLEARLTAEADRGLRYHRRFGLLMIRLEGPDAAVDDAVGAVTTALRPMDVVTDYGLDELAVVVPEVGADELASMAAELAAQVSGVGVSARIGAASFPDHGVDPHELITRARDALREARRRRATQPVMAPSLRPTEEQPVVTDPQMLRVYELARRVADHSITVLVTGETGVGKELVAQTIHRQSRRKDRPFQELNCAALSENLLESELFGHERGAFTGADRRKIGHFEAADGGTLFLDEIGEISAAVQTKLLRVLEDRRFCRVGGTDVIETDVRVVCATNRELDAEVKAGRFREDLYFRISGFAIFIPPLRDRLSEIPLLARRFLADLAAQQGVATPELSAEAERMLLAHDWPGNVRELRNTMERALVMHMDGVITPADLTERVQGAHDKASFLVAEGQVRERLAAVELESIRDAMHACDGNQTHAARRLGISRRALIYKLEKYGLKPKPSSK